jgi:hypothetical protein
MTERERQSLRAWREEVEREERAEREERERPIREAQDKLAETHRQLASVYRERLTVGTDPDVYVDPRVGAGVRMTEQQAAAFNAAEWKTFIQSHPEFYASDANVAALGEYFDRNNLRLITASMLEKLAQRFADLGLLEERPIPELPDPEPEPEEPQTPQTPEPHIGIDPETGLEREYSQFEVNRMSSEQYRKAFRLSPSDMILARRTW